MLCVLVSNIDGSEHETLGRKERTLSVEVGIKLNCIICLMGLGRTKFCGMFYGWFDVILYSLF